MWTMIGSSGVVTPRYPPTVDPGSRLVPVWSMHGELTFDTPRCANDVQRRTSTLLYIIGTFAGYASASRCVAGNSGISAPIKALLQARTTFDARTAWILPSRRYARRTDRARSTSPSCCTRTTVLLKRTRIAEPAASSFA